MRNRLIFAVAALSLLGCASPPPPSPVDEQFGTAVQEAIARQTVHPEALDQQDAPSGMDGQAAKSGIDRYQKSFSVVPATANVFTSGATSSASTTP